MKPGEKEKKTQERVLELLSDTLGYTYLGNWKDRDHNGNVEPDRLRAFLAAQGHEPEVITRAYEALGRDLNDQTKSLYDRNHAVYNLLRYGVHVKVGAGETTKTVWLVDWKHPEANDFAVAEEVTVDGANAKAETKRPDVVLFVNGIALGVLELKRSTVSVSEGIRQNLDNQKAEFIQPFFATLQWVMAGNDTEGLRYGTIQTPEKYYLEWKEDSAIENKLDRALSQICAKARFLEFIHDYVVFDAGVKKLCRHNQYFGIRAAQAFIRRREGGIIWHTQGSGKSLTMVWLAKWIRENVTDARVLIVTDRKELDGQIKEVFEGVNEAIHRTKSGADLLAELNSSVKWLLCSLVHKFGGKEDDPAAVAGYIEEMKRALPANFKPKGDLYVFVDECHRTQSGDLNRAMRAILPNAVFIGFTGTPLLKADKATSREVFGPFIHTYKFNEAVRDGVVLDLRYEARDIDQVIKSSKKIDEWFEAKTKALNPVAKAALKARWGTMKALLSSQERLQQLVNDVMLDMSTRPRLMDGHGNAMLVMGSIYQACKVYEQFEKTDLKGKCAIVTSYAPSPADIKGEESGEGKTEKIRQYDIYRKMLADWFHEPEEVAMYRVDEFETAVKEKFVKQPGQMKLLIVVDKLLTGFDAPPATYLYIDKAMRDHGLFQAICRVNRLDGDDKEYGYIVDYRDLFKQVEGAVRDYTAGALDGYDKDDIAGLLEDRLFKGREHLDEAREAVLALCEDVPPPKDSLAYQHHFVAEESGNAEQMAANEPKRLTLYKLVDAYARAHAAIANEMKEAGYSEGMAAIIAREVAEFVAAAAEVKLASGDYVNLKLYEPGMRQLIDMYIGAKDTETTSALEDLSLVQLIVQQGVAALDHLPAGIKRSEKAVAEAVENNVRKVITQEQPVNPKYYEKMSELLEALIKQRKEGAIAYQQYLAKIVELAKQVQNPAGAAWAYPASLNSPAKRALYDNLEHDEALALELDRVIRATRKDDWRGNRFKERELRNAIGELIAREPEATYIFDVVRNQGEY